MMKMLDETCTCEMNLEGTLTKVIILGEALHVDLIRCGNLKYFG